MPRSPRCCALFVTYGCHVCHISNATFAVLRLPRLQCHSCDALVATYLQCRGRYVQVSRNAQGEEAISEGEQALAEASARAAIASALFGLCPDDHGVSTDAHTGEDGRRLGTPPPAALVFKPRPNPPTSYTMVVEGDDLAAAAAGMHTGYVRPAAGAQKGSVWGLHGSGIGADDGVDDEERDIFEGVTFGSIQFSTQPHQASMLMANGGSPKPGADTGNKGSPSIGGEGGTHGDGLPFQTSPTNPTDASNPSPDPTAAAAPAGSELGDSTQPLAHPSEAVAQTGMQSTGVHIEGEPASKANPEAKPPSGPGLPLFVPGRGDLDVDAVEQHMVELLRVPGAEREGMADTPVMDDMVRSLKNTSLKVGGFRLGFMGFRIS
eukprot:1161263-Pelagomonas_calceolata.AAC.13